MNKKELTAQESTGARRCVWIGTFQEVTKKAKTFRRLCCMDFMMLTFLNGELVWLDTLETAILPSSDYKKNDWIVGEI